MKKLLPFSLLFCCILPAYSANTVVEKIVARVNNRIITLADVQKSKDTLRQEVQQQDPSHADQLYAEREKNVLRDLIDMQLLLDKGADLGITGDTDLIKWLDNMRKEMKLDSMEALEKAATSQGINFEDFKQERRNQIVYQAVIGQEVGHRLNIGKDDGLKYYEEHKKDLERPEEVRLSEIMVSTQPKDADKTKDAAAVPEDPQQIAAAKAKADDLLAQIRKGASFEDVAKKSSDGPTAAQGGDLGDFQRGTLAKELEDKVFAMKTGDVSEVTQTKQGFIILKVVQHQAAGIPPYKEIESRVQEAVYMERLQPALRVYLSHLREDSFIDIKDPSFVDSGATPNETKPVETTEKEAKAKKLEKKKKKMLIF